MTLPTTAAEDWIDDIYNAVVSEALASGWFERVNGHEPTNKPGHGLTCAVWIQAGPDPLAGQAGSGLATSSALITFNVRVYTPMTAEPRDEIDPNVAKAVSNLMRRWHDNYDFGLHPLVRNVDLLGQSGTRLASRAGYVEQSGSLCRVMTITLPVIVNDVWPQGSS